MSTTTQRAADHGDRLAQFKQQVRDVKKAASGRWLEILVAAGVPSEVLDGKHHPCPKCGGKDRFRLIDKEAGAVYCNQCRSKNNSDGLAAVQWYRNCSFKEALEFVAEYLGIKLKKGRKAMTLDEVVVKVSDGTLNESLMALFCGFNEGIYPTGVERMGAIYAQKGSQTVVAFPCIGEDLTTTVNYVCMAALGEMLIRFDRNGKPAGGIRKITAVKGAGLLGAASMSHLRAGTADVVWKCEGPTDLASLMSVIPEDQWGRHVAVSNTHGANENPGWQATVLARAKLVYVVHDTDEAGRRGAEKWAAEVVRAGGKVKIVSLPNERQDLRDFVREDPSNAFARLVELADAAPCVDSADVLWEEDGDDKGSDNCIPYQPFPVEVLPDPLRDFVRQAAATFQCDPGMVGSFALSLLAGAIGNSVRLRLKDSWRVPAVIWTAVIGLSGSMKSPAFRLVRGLLEPIETEAAARNEDAVKQYQAARAKYQRELTKYQRGKDASADPPIEPERPSAERYVTQDTTMEALGELLCDNPRGLLLAIDELSGWVGGFNRYAGGKGGADEAHWLSLHSGTSITIDRKTVERKTIYVRWGSASVMGGIQPAVLRRVLGREHRESGMLARFMLCWPEQKAKVWTDEDIDICAVRQMESVVRSLVGIPMTKDDGGNPAPHVINLSPAATAIWVQFYERHNELRSIISDPDLAAAWSKHEELAPRIALVLHAVRCVGRGLNVMTEIEHDTMQAAIAITEWSRAETHRVYAKLEELAKADKRSAESDDRDDANGENLNNQLEFLMTWVASRGGDVSVRDVARGLRRIYATPRQARDDLLKLAATGRGELYTSSPGPAGGRPSERFRGFVRVRDDKTSKNSEESEVSSPVTEPNKCRPRAQPKGAEHNPVEDSQRVYL